MVEQIQHGSVFPIQLGEMDTNTPTYQATSRFRIPSLTTYPNKTPNTKQSIRINNFVLGIKEKQGKIKTQEILETLAMQISSSDDEDDVTQDNNRFDEPLF